MENIQTENYGKYNYSVLASEKDFIEDVDDVLVVEQKINESKKAKPISMLKSDQCTITHCNIKDDNAQLKEALTILRKKVTSLTREKELLDKAIQGELSEESLDYLRIKAIQSPLIQSMKQRNQELDGEIRVLRSSLADLSEENAELKQQQKEFYTAYELDHKYSTKYRQFKELEKRYDILLDREKALQLKYDNADIMFAKLAQEHNERLAEFKQLDERVKVIKKAIHSKGNKKIAFSDRPKRRGAKGFLKAFFRA